jgi:SSS family solute:Na+ symporter
MTALIVIVGYLALLLTVGLSSSRFGDDTSDDFFLASHSIGPVLLLMSLFGTTMTAFALIGSTGKAYQLGIGTYGLMASWAAVVHPLMFAFVGVRVWHVGRHNGYVTQVQMLRDRFQNDALGWLLFPILVALVVPYLLIGVQGAGITVAAVTKGAFPSIFVDTGGAIPGWLTGLVICAVVFTYVTYGGIRAAAWANTFQTGVFLVVAAITFVIIASALGGPTAAIEATAAKRPELLIRGDAIGQAHFLSYSLVGLSVGMFPHIFQHWLTARSSDTFKLSVIAHPALVAAVWLPCVLIGVWAAGQLDFPPEKANAVLGVMVAKFTTPWMSGVLTAGVLAAIMSSLDSQFLCLGTMFTHDVLLRTREDVSEAQQIAYGRQFVGLVVLATWLLSLVSTRGIFDLGVWCFSGFSALTPILFAALYWRRATATGALAAVVVVIVGWIGLFTADSMGTHTGEFLVGGVMPVTWLFLASTVTMLGVSLATEPPPDHVVDRFLGDSTATKSTRTDRTTSAA